MSPPGEPTDAPTVDDAAPQAGDAAREDGWLEGIIDRLGLAAFTIDHAEQRIVRVNEAYARMFGLPSAAAAMGTSVLDFYADPKERLEIATRFAASREFRETGVGRLEVRRIRQDTREPVDVAISVAATFGGDGRLSRMDCLAEKVGEPRAVERAFRASEERFRTVFEESAIGMAVTDLDGRVARVNAAFAAFVGRGERELLGGDVLALVHDDDRPPRPRPRADGAAATAAEERRFVRPDGEIVWGLVTWSWLSDGDGAPAHSAVVFVQDVTVRKRHEHAMLRMAKLESLGVLAGGIAHDFNNILAVILGSLTVASRSTDVAPATREMLDAAEAAAKRARDLARRLVTFAKGGAPATRVGSLAEIAREAAAFCAGGWPVAVDLAIAPDAPLAEIDPVQITQVLHNLLINAVQASADGGRVRVEVTRASLAPGGPVPLPPGTYARVRVQDEGAGIPAEHLDRIFDPYFSTKPGGTGLGLATVHSIVRRHGGHVAVESAPGRGATFDVYLPESRMEADPPRRASDRPAPPRAARVLVMDDEPRVRDVVRVILRERGIEVEVADDGAAAIAAYRDALAAGRPFAAVILDLTVPGGMGGLEALRRLRALDPDVRAIVSSGYSADPALVDGGEHGFAGSVAKPFTAAELESVVLRVLADRAPAPG